MGKGISTVIASVLTVMIVIGLGGTSYLFVSGEFSSKTTTAFSIADSVEDTIIIRNEGTETLLSFTSVIVDNEAKRALVFDNFDDGAYEGWLGKNGNWFVSDGKLTTTENSKIILAEFDFSNFNLEMVGKGFIGVMFWVNSDSEYYLFDVDTVSSLSEITSTGTGAIKTAPFDGFDSNKEYAYRIVVSENSIKIFIDNELVIDVVIAKPSSGRIGFRTANGVGSVDEVKINPVVLPGNIANSKIYNTIPGRHSVRLCTSSMCNTGYVEIGQSGLIIEKTQQLNIPPTPDGKVLNEITLRNTGSMKISYIDIAFSVSSEIRHCEADWGFIRSGESESCNLSCAIGEQVKVITSRSEHTTTC